MRIFIIPIPVDPDTTPTPEEIAAAKPEADALAREFMEAVREASGAPVRAGIMVLAVLLGDRVQAGLFWAAMHQAQWITFHHPETGEKLEIKDSDPATCHYRVTPLFSTDASRLAAAVTEREINS